MSQNTTLAKSLKTDAKSAESQSAITVPVSLETLKSGKPMKRALTNKQLANLIPAKKGEKRNPKGINGTTSPKAAMVSAAQRLADKAMKVLERNLESEDERIAQQAASMVLDRSFGKPVQPTAETDADGNDRPPPPPMTVVAVQVTR
jgi:hypothetical protein